MPDLQIQQIDQRVYDALGIISRQGFKPRLQEGVSIVVSVPLSIGSQNALGFNDAETDADSAFAGFVQRLAVAGQVGHSQVMNEAASGLNVYVDEVQIMSPAAADNYSIGFYNTALTTAGAALSCLRNGGPTPATVTIRHQTNAVGLGTYWEMVPVVLGSYARMRFDPAPKLTPGTGLIVANNTVNVEHRSSWKLRIYAAG